MEDRKLKRAVLVVSFGTTYEDTRKLTIEAVENRIKNEYSDYEVRRAFTSKVVIKVLKNRDGIFVDTPQGALKKLYREGYEKVFIQPLHLIPGSEYNNLKSIVEEFQGKELFNEIDLGTPAIYKREDYELLIEAVKDLIEKNKTLVFMGHGSYHYSNACYSELQMSLIDRGYKNVFIGTVEGYPSIENVMKWIEENNIKEVTLAPFMLVAGNHAKNDMCGENENSWKSILEKAGIKVNIYFHGLGENLKFQEIYLKHLKEIIG